MPPWKTLPPLSHPTPLRKGDEEFDGDDTTGNAGIPSTPVKRRDEEVEGESAEITNQWIFVREAGRK